MSEHPTNFQGDILAAIEAAVKAAIPDAQVQARGGGGHFEIDVVSRAFEGKRTLGRHQLVLAAVAPLMEGPTAPVHAIDRLNTSVPS